MSHLRDMLTAKALTVLPGQAYNAFRERYSPPGDSLQGPPLHFEEALPADGAEKALVDRVVPSLFRFLRRKKQSLASPGNVLVALFLGDTCFVLPADALYDVYVELEGTSREVLHARASGWLDGPA